MNLMKHDVENREKYEAKSPLSSVITSPEQIAQAMKQTEGKGPTAREFDAQFLAYLDRTHRKGAENQETSEISHVVLFDIDNCGSEFEQIADAFVQCISSPSQHFTVTNYIIYLVPKILVYVVGGPGLPNVSNVKLPIFVRSVAFNFLCPFIVIDYL
jgi:hypothetical protein